MSTGNRYMKFTVSLLAMALGMCVVSGCDKELKLPNSGKPGKIVLIGELIADSSMVVRVGQTMSLSSTAAQFALPNGVVVDVVDGAAKVPLAMVLDPLLVNNTIPYVSENKVSNGKEYIVNASHLAMGTATASVYIPSPVSADTRDTVTTMYGSSRSLQITVDINDPASEKNYYVIEVLEQQVILVDGGWGSPPDTIYPQGTSRKYIHTNDERSENFINGSTQTQNRRVFFNDRAFNGRTLTTQIYIPDDMVYNGNQYELLMLKVKSVSEDYYNFLKAYEEYEPAGGFNTNNAPVKMDGNVVGGMGMVGGVSQKVFRYVVPVNTELTL